MNYVISITVPEALGVLEDICEELSLPLNVTLHGHGTAVQSMLDLLGIESNERRVVLTVANRKKTGELMKEQKKSLYMGIPGHGISCSVPIKSVGGGNTVAYLNQEEKNAKYTPELNFKYELIVAITNEGHNDQVMNAAREAGAGGGTVLHGKGTGAKTAEKFLNVTIAGEKEVILIVARSDRKSEIMQRVLEKAGPGTPAGTILFSLPTSEVAGFGMFDED